jgi:acyl-CoA thioesterase FadM
LLQEARVRFLHQHGFSEINIDGCGLIMTDAAIVYRKQALYGDRLAVEVGLMDQQRSGCDFVYRVTKIGTDELVAEAKTGVVFFDYQTQKVQRMPGKFAALFV